MTRITGLALTLSMLAACGSDPPPPAQAPVAPIASYQAEPQAPPPGQDPRQATVNIAEDIRKACGISESEAYFAFNSAEIRQNDKAVFQKLARCFTTGALKGRDMRLIGHADPRGEDEYNMVLGEKRASNVRDAIGNEGLEQAKMQTTSRGEMDATGTDEPSWAKDRRVDIMLGN